MHRVWITQIVDVLENGDAVVELPEGMLEILGWKEGDRLDISVDENNRIIVKKVEQ